MNFLLILTMKLGLISQVIIAKKAVVIVLYNEKKHLYRTSGVIFFIDYCTAIRDT
jgi:hypothetical protein